MKTIIVLVICFLYTSTYGQFENISFGPFDLEENTLPVVSINLKNNNNIVAIAGNNVYSTEDGGKTWAQKSLTSSAYQVLSNKKGDFFIFHNQAPACSISDDEGQSWSETGTVALEYFGKGMAVADPNGSSVYKTWLTTGGDGDKCKILFNHSNNGKKWGKPDLIRWLSSDCNQVGGAGAVPAIGPEGELYVAWADENKIWLDRSLNKGKFWLTSDIVVSGMSARNTPVVIADNSNSRYRGMLYFSWASASIDNTEDVLFSMSANHGDTWTSPKRVNEQISGASSFGSWMAMDFTTGVLYLIYYKRTEAGKIDVYVAYSEDRGSSFVRKKISESSFTANLEDIPNAYIAAHEGRIVPVWVRIEEGNASLITTVIEQKDLMNVNAKADINKNKKQR